MHKEYTPLAQAFLHQSLAAVKNRIRAQKAAQDGRPGAAAALNALAEAQDVHAKKALMLLRGRIGSTDANLAEALQETRELAVDALGWTVLAQAESDKAAAALLIQMSRALTSHLALPGLPGYPEAQTRAFVCAICGHIHTAGEPGRCPVCQAVPEKFTEVQV